MRIWKQLLLCIVVLAGALGLWVYLVPSAGGTLTKMGVPGEVIAAVIPRTAAQPAPAPAGGANGNAAARPQGEGGAQGAAQNGQRGAGGQGGGQGGNRATLIVAQPVVIGTVNDRLSAIGSGEAIQSVVVMPQASGTVNEIMVTSGQKVTKGQVLARLDDEEQTIERDKARVALASAQEKSASYKNLQSFSRLDVFDAQIAEQAAKLALSTAELNLRRRDIVAPIDGIAGIVAVNIGDNVTTQTNVVTIDDRSAILVDFWAPERFAVAIQPGQAVEASSIARPGQVFSGKVEAIDNRVDPASRTMRIRARVENPGDALRAGMAFNVGMRFAGERYPAVDPLAIQWDGEGSYVWQVRENKSVKTRVRVVQRNPDAVLVGAELKEGDRIVTEGLQRVREGAAVRILGAPETAEVARQ
ncbi:efflux RND transporter periplasmic adaptor subunit [Neorhizobium galegae]|uniref:efflux RND transporter periplasmic adaptor subunit n=1 Tax=Neorhizobium galegae TaxID=399 RepID=UPI0006227665|nr:efflux RND transporter periplasmic adaptor subunit [Neorhizobium galegae]KAB1124937.1 efflux RND transporter periplasmic adaptor subunit [Neorhizobium galegae]MCQ1809788.1 efflux RND transporter periplasmic adaptor subunit [Neorhizobium galegae]CDZ61567.1 Efflux transporter, RND family, MFP subunit [Neorhizobium galegae bv. orientalis]CDZ72824.1 Efflux transporter, RND family, MFP subunit [Neorhizobium galegae bv. orientalis]